MNPLYKYKCFLSEWGIDIEYNYYDVSEIEAVEAYLKLRHSFTPFNFAKMLGNLGLIRVIDITEQGVEYIINNF